MPSKIRTISVGDGLIPKIGDTAIYYSITFDNHDRVVLLGVIGNTSCCGSAEVFGHYPGGYYEDFKDIVRLSKASILLFRNWNYWEEEGKYGDVDAFNKAMEGIAKMTAQMEDYALLCVIEILDQDKYQQWLES